MPSVNMIAPRRAEKYRLERNIGRLLLGTIVEVVMILAILGIMVSRIYVTKVSIGDLEMQYTKLQPTVRKIADFEKATQALKPKLDTLNRAKSTTERWCRVMENLSASLPEKIWLTRLSTALNPDPRVPTVVININGISVSQELVGDAMLRMHDMIQDFGYVDLRFTQKTLVGRNPAFEFELAAGLKIQEQEDKEEVAKS